MCASQWKKIAVCTAMIILAVGTGVMGAIAMTDEVADNCTNCCSQNCIFTPPPPQSIVDACMAGCRVGAGCPSPTPPPQDPDIPN
jgi:hypothetical protein